MTAPTWDPQQYLRHADHRTRPFHDLLARIEDPPGLPDARIADLGCGAGNVTVLLAARWPKARITGFDNSPQMLERARTLAGPLLDFAEADATIGLVDFPSLLDGESESLRARHAVHRSRLRAAGRRSTTSPAWPECRRRP